MAPQHRPVSGKLRFSGKGALFPWRAPTPSRLMHRALLTPEGQPQSGRRIPSPQSPSHLPESDFPQPERTVVVTGCKVALRIGLPALHQVLPGLEQELSRGPSAEQIRNEQFPVVSREEALGARVRMTHNSQQVTKA